jgi:hypothetical protein
MKCAEVCGSDKRYIFITYSSDEKDEDTSRHFTYFLELMEKLRVCEDQSFWDNRLSILKSVPHLTIVAVKETNEIVAFYVLEHEADGSVKTILTHVFSEHRRIGKRLIVMMTCATVNASYKREEGEEEENETAFYH